MFGLARDSTAYQPKSWIQARKPGMPGIGAARCAGKRLAPLCSRKLYTTLEVTPREGTPPASICRPAALSRQPTYHAVYSLTLLRNHWPVLPGLEFLALLATLSCSLAGEGLPLLQVVADDTRITHSCRIEIKPGLVIADDNRNGVLHVAADGIRIEFAPGTVLRGAASETPWDELEGIGIRIDGRTNVTLSNAQVHGFRSGIVATGTDGLAILGGDFSDNYRQRLRSTPSAEHSGDWLFPHHNDRRKWREEYGGAICIEDARGVTIRDVRVRRGQNGILLDRVHDSWIYDNDASFLSGWGLALWRSSGNVVSRNAFDFCVRGHVEGVYNRGQDSAGILAFEQCNNNQFVENSATHGGDGFFGFAGREALGELWLEDERERLRRETGRQEVESLVLVSAEVAQHYSSLGCNRNLLLGNDFSYAAAHGIEMTFSIGNEFIGNRLVENAICGIWGGYSSETLIAANHIEGNGGMAYGLERGGVNMEHAADNRIVDNRFLNNKCAVHLWWDDDGALLQAPGVVGQHRGVSGNVIAGNRFEINDQHPFANLRPDERLLVLQLRDHGSGFVTNNAYFDNLVALNSPAAREFAIDPGCAPRFTGERSAYEIPAVDVPGERRPVGARQQLRGRHQIILDEWGPWDHESPLLRSGPRTSGRQTYDLFGFEAPSVRVLDGSVEARIVQPVQEGPHQLLISAEPGVTTYRVEVRAKDVHREVAGTLITTNWEVTVFAWDIDPREDLDGWRALAEQPGALTAQTDHLVLRYGWAGPREMNLSPEITARGPGNDQFGMIARTHVELAAGRWRVTTLSDDGVRVLVNGEPVIENWTWHGPTRDSGSFEQKVTGEVEIVVEHFEIDGYAVLEFDLEPA
jgi:parallel beta-helix repeat protein